MTLSEVLYVAACEMSEKPNGWFVFSCNLVAEVETGKPWDGTPRPKMSRAYARLMTSNPNRVIAAANAVNWIVKDFRTFMLLMASEAVR